MDANFYKFLELSGITITEDTNLTPLLADYWSFTAYAAEYPNNIYELNFIKWQLKGKIKTTNQTSPQQVNTTPQYQTPPQQVNTTTPQSQTPPQQINPYQYQTSPQQISIPSPTSVFSPSKVLTADFPPLPVKLAKLKKHVNTVEGRFNTFTLETPRTPEQSSETIIIDEKSTKTEPEITEPIFPALTTYLDGFISGNEETQIPQVYNTPVKVNRGKDISVARKKFEEETETEKKEKKTPARKRKRECGRSKRKRECECKSHRYMSCK
ncbi:Hypothetical predicted protein [Paramuricea clavata]|uniref:Uncharacterized protein n=1 Tax=Paramuricea clavata TaxID=317549 RepID=A0A6S7HRU3_PARCT|nr:Hypothetical predicted protein [Paramuricea clavata]